MTAREEILDRIRTAIGSAAAPASGSVSGSVSGSAPVPRDYRQAGEHAPGEPELLELLIDRLVDYKATVRQCAATEVTDTVTAMLDARGLRRLVVPARAVVDLTAWAGEAVIDRPEAPLDVAALDGVDGVLTGCAVAIAETGTIVLDASPDQGRRAITLVPDYHLVVVRADQVVQTVPEALTRLDPRRPLTWISGPSATSDIELSRVEGVHGPRTLDVVLVG